MSDGEFVEGRCEEFMDDLFDVIFGVVEDLIFFLEGVEVISSDEFEVEGELFIEFVEGNDLVLFGGVIRLCKLKGFRR